MDGKTSHGFYADYLKRIVDIILGAILFIVFLPIGLLLAILIKVETPGPILADVPERIGKDGRTFKMYKFRSMIQNAHEILRTDPEFKELYEEYKRSSYKLAKDPRVTDIGRFIRKYSLDEIPQIINLFKGDMSLVGPRAYYPDELENQQDEFPHVKNLVKKVLSVKPGITGLWQVSGRSNVNFDKRIEIDAEYVDNLSLLHDIMIILKTPFVMITGKGAV